MCQRETLFNEHWNLQKLYRRARMHTGNTSSQLLRATHRASVSKPAWWGVK
jgi:hypothetical protein